MATGDTVRVASIAAQIVGGMNLGGTGWVPTTGEDWAALARIAKFTASVTKLRS